MTRRYIAIHGFKCSHVPSNKAVNWFMPCRLMVHSKVCACTAWQPAFAEEAHNCQQQHNRNGLMPCLSELHVPQVPNSSRSILCTIVVATIVVATIVVATTLVNANIQIVKLIPSHLETVRMHPRCHLRQNRRPYAAAALLSLPHHLQCSSSPVGLPCQAQSAPSLHAFNEQHIIAVHPLQQRWALQNLTRHPFTPSAYCLEVCAARLLKLNEMKDNRHAERLFNCTLGRKHALEVLELSFGDSSSLGRGTQARQRRQAAEVAGLQGVPSGLPGM